MTLRSFFRLTAVIAVCLGVYFAYGRALMWAQQHAVFNAYEDGRVSAVEAKERLGDAAFEHFASRANSD
jgi:hypothetical protein